MDKTSKVSETAQLSAPVTAQDQVIQCEITIGLEKGQYVYSAHKKSLGLPTTAEFKGRGYVLVGSLVEPPPTRKVEEGMPISWIHEGQVRLTQEIRITDPESFQLVLRVYAQICDGKTCHEFTDVVVSDGEMTTMMDFRGNFESSPSLHD